MLMAFTQIYTHDAKLVAMLKIYEYILYIYSHSLAVVRDINKLRKCKIAIKSVHC